MDASVHAGGERAALEAVTAECARIESGGGAGLDDAGDSAGVASIAARHGAGEGGLTRLAASWGTGTPDAEEHRAFGNAGGVLPAAQRAHQTEFGGAVGDGDGDAAARAVTLGARQGQADRARATSAARAGLATRRAPRRGGRGGRRRACRRGPGWPPPRRRQTRRAPRRASDGAAQAADPDGAGRLVAGCRSSFRVSVGPFSCSVNGVRQQGRGAERAVRPGG